MRIFEEISVFVLAAFIEIATSTPTLPVMYTLYAVNKTWNEARAVCESNGQQMLKLDTQARFEDFLVWRNIWGSNGLLTAEGIWTGLHQHVLTDPTVFNLEWHDCEPLGNWAPWDNKEPNAPEAEKCVRIRLTNNKARTYPCGIYRQVVCQESTEECTFERFEGRDVGALTPASSIDVNIDDCQRACLTYTGSIQCVVVVYDNETTSGDPCWMYTRQQVYINDIPEMTSSSGRTVLVKRCVQGDYVATAVSVPPNRDNDPITTCFEATSSTAIMASVPITASSTYPGTSMDIQLSILTNTQSESIHSSYVSFSNVDPVGKSVFTTVNMFPGTSSQTSSSVTSPETSVIETGASSESQFTSTRRMYSVDISMTSSSVKTSVIETESIELHLTSTMKSLKLTPISLYSSTSSGAFDGGASPSLYWRTDHLTSIAESMTNAASVSNVVALETVMMTMSESSKITTLPPGMVDTASEGTKSASTIVSVTLEPESSAQVSSLDFDPSIVGLSTSSSSPWEHYCVCACMVPLMSVATDVNGYLLDRKNLSSYRRSKTSANDERVSAKAIGGSGLAIILLVTAVIVCGDVDRMVRAMGRWRKRQTLPMFSSMCCKSGDKL